MNVDLKSAVNFKELEDALNGMTKGFGVASCYPNGNCTKETLVQNYTLHDKVYTPEDSMILRAMSMFASKMLAGNYITVVPNVKDKVPIYRDDMEIYYQSEATGGRNAQACGPFMPTGKVNVVTNKCLSVTYMYIEAAICYKKLIGTYKMGLLRPGAGGADSNTSLNNMVLDKIMNASNMQTDMLIWQGDYKSSRDLITHYDGLIKRIYNAIGAIEYQTYCISLKEGKTLTEDDCIYVRVGGQDMIVPFNTDNATTLSDAALFLQSLTHDITCQPLLTVSFDGVSKLTVTSNYDLEPISVTMRIVACETDECADLNVGCCAAFCFDETVPFHSVDKPLTIPYCRLTTGNVLDVFTKLYLKVSAEKPELLNSPDFYFHVSPHAWAVITAANVHLLANSNGLNGTPNSNPTPFGLKIVMQPSIPHHVIIGTRTSNIFFGTDLISDQENFETWVNKDCQEVRYRHEVFQGVQIDRYAETVSNLECAPFKFMPPMDDGCTDVLNPCGDSKSNCA